MQLNRFIESTNLDPKVRGREIDQLIHSALDHQLLGACVPPFWVKRASREIAGHDIQLVTVIGYPLGYQMTETKVEEARLAIRDGANELDLVLNFSAFQDGMSWPKIEIAKMAKVAHEEGLMIKVILETSLWTDQQLEKMAKLAADAGADYVKTSTGYHMPTVKPETIALLRQVLPSNVGIKASGGISSRSLALELVDAGADRLGTSRALDLLT
ncbi:MAG: deoxyribose-phosphate aldolase [Cyclobacteriaceae bacterium]|nr:deoxyribose-phosphate aldolase [Cyclobacteriaceae bacterium HetDA_MAG_MS6]